MELTDIKCIQLEGEFKKMGNHILLPNKVTLCGIPTVEADNQYLLVIQGSYYKNKKWNITCERCIEIFQIVKKSSEQRNINNEKV